jgi:hypothetical protein
MIRLHEMAARISNLVNPAAFSLGFYASCSGCTFLEVKEDLNGWYGESGDSSH